MTTIWGLQGGWRYYDARGYSVHSVQDCTDRHGQAYDAYETLLPAALDPRHGR